MAKINVCDICKADGKLVETKIHITMQGPPELELDVCEHCATKVKPLTNIEYVKYVFKLKGIDLTGDKAKSILGKKMKLTEQ